MSEFEQLYREVILDHYKTPRNHGLLDPSDAVRRGPEPALRRRGDGVGAVRGTAT